MLARYAKFDLVPPPLSLYFNVLDNWHAPCKVSGIAAGRSGIDPKGRPAMTIRFTATRILCSAIGALVFATIAVGTAVPVLPVA